MDSADDTSGWTDEHLHAAICGIAEVHSIWYGREQELLEQPWMLDYPTLDGMAEKRRLWEMLGVHSQQEFPEWFSRKNLEASRNRTERRRQAAPQLSSASADDGYDYSKTPDTLTL